MFSLCLSLASLLLHCHSGSLAEGLSFSKRAAFVVDGYALLR